MRPRQDITKMFSTFLRIEEDCSSYEWIVDATLRRSMQIASMKLTLEGSSCYSEESWACYWYKLWRDGSNKLALLHLTAYLQETFYWVALKMATRYPSSQNSIADYLQTANTEVDRILAGFQPERSSSLKNYAKMAASSRLRDKLRSQTSVNTYSTWGLLSVVSPKRVRYALAEEGLSKSIIEKYYLVWRCFKKIYYVHNGRLPLAKPEHQFLELIASCYNQSSPSETPLDANTVERLLIHTANTLRSYLYPKVAYGIDNFDLPAKNQDSLGLAQLIADEEEQYLSNQLSQINSLLIETIQHLDSQSQEILKLYYGQKLTQSEIKNRLQIGQASVSRRLVKVRESLLEKLVEYGKNYQNSYGLTLDKLKDLTSYLDEWLYNNISKCDLNNNLTKRSRKFKNYK
jgi:RNA polymerase sigma factor (sigma-70 family)